jgi:hypothetical protein
MSEQMEFPTPQGEKPVQKKSRTPFFWPAMLIVAGLILLIQNFNYGVQLNWWALFIFIPVAASLNTGLNRLRESGRFDQAVAGSLGSVVMVGTIAVMLLLGLDWSFWWPLTVIAAGTAIFINGIPSLFGDKDLQLSSLLNWSLWIGISAVLLGIGFLALSLPIPAIKTLLVGYRWWAFPILIAGIGALISALVLLVRNQGKMGWTAWGLVAAGVVTLVVGGLAFYNIDWNFLLPVILIAFGVIVLTGVLRKK